MEKSAKLGNKDAVKFVGGTVELNDKEKPLEFAQLKQIYNEIVQQVSELLQQLDPAISSKLLDKSRVPKTLPLSSEGSDEECDTEQSETTDYKASIESLSQPSGEESEVESTTSMVDKAVAPKTTKFLPGLVKGPLISMAQSVIGSTVGGVLSPAEPTVTAKSVKTKPVKAKPVKTKSVKAKPIEGKEKNPFTPLQQSPYPPFPPSMIPPNLFQSQSPPYGAPYSPYLQNIYQTLGQTPFGLQMPPQNSYQPQSPFRQGVPAMYPQGLYQPQNAPAYGVPDGYPYGSYQPQNTPPPAYGVPTGYSQGFYQPQNPLGQGVYTGYSQILYQPQSPPGQWQSVQPSYPQSYYQQQSFPQPFGQHPPLTRSPKRGLSPSHTRSQNRGLHSYSLSPSSTPGCPPITTRSVPGYSPSEYGLTSLIKMPADRKGLQSRSPAFSNLEGEVLKSLKDIDDQLNVILTKLEQK